jgi:hypothetical protein
MPLSEFPQGKKFAFTILDEAETASVEVLRPFYTLLQELGIAATKTVWSRSTDERTGIGARCSLDDPKYLDFILELRDRGFEIGWSGASSDSNDRERTIEGLEQFRAMIGSNPRVYVNSNGNRDGIYGGTDRIDEPLLKAVVHRAAPTPAGYFQGHVETSPFWWGDLCLERVEYVLNLTFDDVNIARVNPTLPYHDPSRPYVRWWFSGSDAENCSEFNQLLRPDRQERLERENGCCIVATRIGRGFARNGQIDRLARKRLESLAARPGWFVPVSTLLDRFRLHNENDQLGSEEWERMQWKWARDIVRRRVRHTVKRDSEWLDAAVR